MVSLEELASWAGVFVTLYTLDPVSLGYAILWAWTLHDVPTFWRYKLRGDYVSLYLDFDWFVDRRVSNIGVLSIRRVVFSQPLKKEVMK